MTKNKERQIMEQEFTYHGINMIKYFIERKIDNDEEFQREDISEMLKMTFTEYFKKFRLFTENYAPINCRDMLMMTIFKGLIDVNIYVETTLQYLDFYEQKKYFNNLWDIIIEFEEYKPYYDMNNKNFETIDDIIQFIKYMKYCIKNTWYEYDDSVLNKIKYGDDSDEEYDEISATEYFKLHSKLLFKDHLNYLKRRKFVFNNLNIKQVPKDLIQIIMKFY